MTKEIDLELLEKLKDDWLKDPSWDLPTTPGFEDDAEHLKAFQEQYTTYWKDDHKLDIAIKASKLECSLELAEYLMGLEEKITKLEKKLSK